ncbi:MAG TPA: peptide deformylase [Patescibacteria group bacterium]|nr:peptide deformylase [Patescibacteria group bacterium]
MSTILTVPNPVLRAQSKDVVIDKKVGNFLKDLEKTVIAARNPRGVGLSAPQIGKNWNVFVTWMDEADPHKNPSKEDICFFINPKLTGNSGETTYGPDKSDPILEGCLSIPKIYGPVPRFTWIDVSFLTLQKGEFIQKEARFNDFFARVIQHEYDHLQGKLFTDYSIEHDLPVYEFEGKHWKKIDKTILKAY